MRKISFFTVLSIAAGIAGAAAVMPAAFAQGSSGTAAVGGAAELGIVQIVQRLEGAGYRSITSVERERGSYEVKAVDADGRRVELDVDAWSGEVLKTEVKRDRRQDGKRAAPAQR